MPRNSQLYTNLNGLGHLLGGFSGVATGAEEDAYMGSVIRSAHRKVANIFDVAAAATARTGRFTHMFEFGTQGVTRGVVEHTDPAAPDARLWVHTIVGRGKSQEIGFKFRPARTQNPALTTAGTGVASKYIRKMSRRKYIFREKAMVMETGMEVSIAPKKGRFLFVPFGQNDAINPANTKNFVLWDASRLGPIKERPGQNVAGNFGTFWTGWWRGQGGNEMAKAMTEDIRHDVVEAVKRTEANAVKEGRKLTSVEASNIKWAYSRAEKLSKHIFDEFTASGGYVVE